jgi:tetrahydromethanopterin S-methyltransferase subunit F
MRGSTEITTAHVDVARSKCELIARDARVFFGFKVVRDPDLVRAPAFAVTCAS